MKSKNRYVNTEFWRDEYIENLDIFERYLYLYCITNPLTNVAGIYKISLKRTCFETGIEKNMLLKMFTRFEEDGKIKYQDGYLLCRNTIKHQKLNHNIKKGIEDIINECPPKLVKWLCGKALYEKDGRLKIDFESLSNPLNYINININTNINRNTNNQNQDCDYPEFSRDIENEDTEDENQQNNDNEKEKQLNRDVELIYKLYPSKCPNTKNPLSKTKKDKIKIRKLIVSKQYTTFQMLRTIEKYIDLKTDDDLTFKPQLQYLSTFLNNFPDYSDIPREPWDIPGAIYNYEIGDYQSIKKLEEKKLLNNIK